MHANIIKESLGATQLLNLIPSIDSHASRTMLLKKLPIELLQQIIADVIEDNDPRNAVALLRVNSKFEIVTTNVYRHILQGVKSELDRWRHFPFQIRRRIAHDAIMSLPGPDAKPSIATYMHAVASYLQEYSRKFDTAKTGSLGYTQWLHDICAILALPGADCKCGKPAFMHSRCYSLDSVPDTAFHIVILKQHTKLETVMIEEGKGVSTVCPYLKVSKKDPKFWRRNALEWACAYGLEDSARRIIRAAEEGGKRAEAYLPTAAAISAVYTKDGEGKLLEFLLERLNNVTPANPWVNKLQYQDKSISCKEWNRRITIELAKHKNTYAVLSIIRHYPYLDHWTAFDLLPRKIYNSCFKNGILHAERPYCDWGRTWQEDDRYPHWLRCSKVACRNRYSKAYPYCKLCECHHEESICERCGRHHRGQRTGQLYDYNGWLKDLY